MTHKVMSKALFDIIINFKNILQIHSNILIINIFLYINKQIKETHNINNKNNNTFIVNFLYLVHSPGFNGNT